MRYYLNIGTNLGDRRHNLMLAIAALSAGTGGCQVSSVMESQPWGFDSPHAFLNVGVAIDTALAPMQVLGWIHDIERQLGSASHRDAAGGYVDRLVDIDIVYAEALAPDGRWQRVGVDSRELTIPHSHLMERDFFLQPLRQLHPATFTL